MSETTQETGDALVLDDFLPYRLAVLSNTISTAIADLYDREFGLSIWQWRIMAVLGQHPGLSATEAGARAAMEKVAVSRAVAGLTERGLLARTPAPSDGRRFELRLTAEGEAMYRRIIPIAKTYERDLIAGLNAEDLAALNALLTKLASLASPDTPLWRG